MNGQPSLYRSDIRPLEFTLAVIVGGIGSAVLSALHFHPLFSVSFALLIMGVLAYLRWRIASEIKDFQSLEAFAEDIYLLGYLLTLSALLGLAPRLMSDDTNLFNIAGLKLVTTVVGLGMMMIFRQTARRWAEEKEGETQEKFEQQQQRFSDAVARLNQGADELTAKLDEVVRRFDPELLNPVAEWSNRAAGAFSAATNHLEAVPAAVLTSLHQLSALNDDLGRVKTAAAELAGVLTSGTAQAANVLTAELGNVSQAAGSFGAAMVALTPTSEAAQGAMENLGSRAAKGATELGDVSEGFHRTALELGKVERALKKLGETETKDLNAPMNRLVEALDKSAAHATTSAERVATLNNGLQSFTAASQEVAKRMETHVGTPLAENQQALDRMQQQMIRAAEQIERVAKQLEATAASQPDGATTVQLLAQLSGLRGEMRQTNAHFKTLLERVDGSPQTDNKPRRWFGIR